VLRPVVTPVDVRVDPVELVPVELVPVELVLVVAVVELFVPFVVLVIPEVVKLL
jgi:hypothetical protein